MLIWVVSLLIIMVFVVMLLLNVPQVQNFLKDAAVNYVSKKLNTKVYLSHININFPDAVELDSLYLTDQKGDTLVYTHRLYVGIDMLGLLSGSVKISKLELNDFSAYVYRTLPDTTFNFQYIIDAFSSGEPSSTDTKKSSTTFTINDISLSRLHLRYKDDVTGYDADAYLGEFNTHFKTFDLDSMRFILDSINLSGIYANIKQAAPLVANMAIASASTESSNRMPELSFDELAFNRIYINYDNTAAGMSGLVDMGKLLIVPNKLNLNKQLIDLKKLALNQTIIDFKQYKGTIPSVVATSIPTDTISTSSAGWTVKLDQLQLDSNNLKYDNALEPETAQGIDFNHVAVNNFKIDAGPILYSTDSSHAVIHQISFNEHSGFILKKLTTTATYTSHSASLENLDLETANSRLKKKIAITYASLKDMGEHPGEMGIMADLTDCVIDLNDVLYFQPSLDDDASMKKLMHSIVMLDGSVNGKLKDLNIDQLEASTAQQTHLAMKGHLTGLRDMDKAVFDVKLDDFSTGRKDLYALLPRNAIPSSISIPSQLALSGTYKGSLSDFTTQLGIKSTYGNMAVQARARNMNDSLHAAYRTLLNTNQLDLGKLLKNDTMYGKVTLQAEVNGKGLTKNSIEAKLVATIKQAWLNQYNYKNVALSGNFHQQKGQLNMEMKDPNLKFKLVSSADLSAKYPAVKLNLDLDSINLQALHFSADTLKFRGKIIADFPEVDVDHLNGQMILSGLQIVKGEQKVGIDSITLKALTSDTMDQLQLDAPFAKAAISGHYQLSKTGALIQSLIQNYFGRDSSTHALEDSVGKEDMHLKLALFNHPLWQQMLPQLESFSGASFNGELSSAPQKVQLKGGFSQIVWGDTEIDSVTLGLQSNIDRLNYALSVNAINNGSMKIHKTTLNGYAADNQLNINLRVRDVDDKEKYQLAGLLALDKDTYKFSFNPDSLLLDYSRWQVPQDNYIVYQPEGIVANNLKIENKEQYLLINTPGKSPGAPLEVDFHNFQLETLTKIVSKDTALASGSLNGKVVGDSLLQTPVFTADLKIDSLALNNQLVGNMSIKVNNKVANQFAVDMALTGDSNDLSITGTYFTQPQSKFDIKVSIPSLSLASAQAFTFGQVTKASGILTGDLHLQGTTDKPQITGALTFKKAAVNITKVNDYLTMPDETIRFDDKGIHFNRFTLIDSLSNKAIIDGDVLTTNYEHFQFTLDLTARNFRALNAKKSADEFFYGPVFMDADVRVRGNEDLPKVDIKLKLNKNSILTVVLPGSNPAVESSEGIVEFVDASHIKDTVQLGLSKDTIERSELTGIQLSANISVDTAAVMNIVIDPTNGDNLRVQGNASLNMTMDPSGKISLTGRYEIINGAYSMSLKNLIKRKFDIKKGSSITWTGDPTSAILDLTAIYHIETSAMELVEDQLTDATETTKNTYKQKLPFNVDLNLNGELMEPDISFALDMPQTSRNAFNGSVYTRIQQINTSESEVNKQVLGLLVLGHFIAENPFQSAAGGGGAEQMVRQSASKILSQQLNNMAGNLIQGVDINFDLESSQDYSTGTAENRTNLNVGLSKSLFNDRTTVYVGSNIQLEGSEKANQRTSQIAGDVAIEYKLSRDGRYRLRAYRKNKYQGVIEGEFIETGLDFIIVMDYDHFSEIFHKAKKEEQEFK